MNAPTNIKQFEQFITRDAWIHRNKLNLGHYYKDDGA